MKIRRTAIEAFPGIFAEYHLNNGRRELLGVVSPHGDPLDRVLNSVLMLDGRGTALDYVRNLICGKPSQIDDNPLARRLLDPEDLGFQATAEIRDAARREIGLDPVETVAAITRSAKA